MYVRNNNYKIDNVYEFQPGQKYKYCEITRNCFGDNVGYTFDSIPMNNEPIKRMNIMRPLNKSYFDEVLGTNKYPLKNSYGITKQPFVERRDGVKQTNMVQYMSYQQLITRQQAKLKQPEQQKQKKPTKQQQTKRASNNVRQRPSNKKHPVLDTFIIKKKNKAVHINPIRRND